MDLQTLARVKSQFFDRAVADKLDPAVKRALSKFGAFVRQRARTSIRTRKTISAPGQPPSSHTGLLKRAILFAFDADRQSVVVGPYLLNQKIGGEVLTSLEYGGPSRALERKGGHLRGATYRNITVRARPFMAPAFKAELAAVGNDFRSLIR